MSNENYLEQTENSSDSIVIVQDVEIKQINAQLLKMFGCKTDEEMLGRKFTEFAAPEYHDFMLQMGRDREKGKHVPNQYIFKAVRCDGTQFDAELSVSVIEFQGEKARQGIIKDISNEKEKIKTQQKAHEKLKRQQEARIKDMEVKLKSHEELNEALKILLNKKDGEKNEIEDTVLTNVKRLVVPYLEKMKKTELDDQQEVFLDIIEANIDEIISPFSRKMSIKESNLTPNEIQIANLIMQGATSKKIGEIMKISPRTVDAHRKNIRKKIGLTRRRMNLRSYLLSVH